MDASPNDERFEQVESVLNLLSNSQRQLLQAQVIMNDRLSKTETFVERMAQQMTRLTGDVQKLAGTVDKLADEVSILAEGQKHNDVRIDALADMFRHFIEGNGKGSQ